MVGLQSQDGGKKGEKERESRKKRTRRKTRKGKRRCWYQRRNELDTSVYGRLRGRYYDVQARARCSFLQPHPHTNLFLFSFFLFLFFFFSFSFLFFFFRPVHLPLLTRFTVFLTEGPSSRLLEHYVELHL